MNEIILFFDNIDFNWSIIEASAIFFSIIYIVLAAKQNIWCWAAAVISVFLYIFFCYTSQLFAETGLQIFYLIMACYGYYNWKKNDRGLQIIQWTTKKHFLLISLGVISTFLMGFYFTNYTDAQMPIIDSFTTTFALFATYMVTKKVLENWLYWIVIDCVSIYLYFTRDLHLTALLFIAYTIIAIFGYFTWLKKIKSNG